MVVDLLNVSCSCTCIRIIIQCGSGSTRYKDRYKRYFKTKRVRFVRSWNKVEVMMRERVLLMILSNIFL